MYVNAFTLISRKVEPGLREFALAAASLGDSAGIAVADIAGEETPQKPLHLLLGTSMSARHGRCVDLYNTSPLT